MSNPKTNPKTLRRMSINEAAWLAVITGLAEWTGEDPEKILALAGPCPDLGEESDDLDEDGLEEDEQEAGGRR